MEQSKQILSAILDVGEIMLISGAEVNRVENTVTHMAGAYGYVKVDVFTITASIVVTVHENDGNIETQTRRIHGYDTDMRKVERCNALSRSVCAQCLPLEELRTEIREIRNGGKYPSQVIFFFYGMNSAVLSVFFGGSVWDALAAFVGGLLLRIVQLICIRLKVQSIIQTMICAAAAGVCAVFMVAVGPGDSVDKIIIGNIMLLIPGLAFTTSLRDMINGDIISGLLGLCEAVLRAVAIAIGFSIVLWRWGGGF